MSNIPNVQRYGFTWGERFDAKSDGYYVTYDDYCELAQKLESNKKHHQLSDAAYDTLYSLFFRGALPSGDLPSKSGAAELRDLGLAETAHTKIITNDGDYFTYLTPAGQEEAIKHFGRKED